MDAEPLSHADRAPRIEFFKHLVFAWHCPLDTAYLFGNQTFMTRVIIELDSSRGQTDVKWHTNNDSIVNWSWGNEGERQDILPSARPSWGSEVA